jgi:hypothetical protein
VKEVAQGYLSGQFLIAASIGLRMPPPPTQSIMYRFVVGRENQMYLNISRCQGFSKLVELVKLERDLSR